MINDENEQEINLEKVVKDFCVEFSASMLRSEAERDFRKQAVSDIAERLSLDKAILNFCGKTYHKQDFDKKTEATNEMLTFYSNIFGSAESSSGEDPDEDLD